METNNTCNEGKITSSYTRKINTLRKKWLRDVNILRIRKYETNQLHSLCTRLINEGRLSIDELKASVNSREDIKKILNLVDYKKYGSIDEDMC